MEILRKNKKEMLGINNAIILMKNTSDEVILDWTYTGEKLSELEDMKAETSNFQNKKYIYQDLWDNYKRYI